MRDGERLVWAAAFSAGIAAIDMKADPEEIVAGLARAVVSASHAVGSLRGLAKRVAETPDQFKEEPWGMLRAMAGIDN